MPGQRRDDSIRHGFCPPAICGSSCTREPNRIACSCYAESWVGGLEEPYYSVSSNHLISKFASENQAKVLLSGIGADELFCGYNYYKRANLPLLSLDFTPNFDSKNYRSNSVSRLLSLLFSNSRQHLYLNLFQKFTDSELRNLFSDEFAPPCRVNDYIEERYPLLTNLESNLSVFTYMDMKLYVGNHQVHRIDRAMSAYSLEGRFPFLDHELIEASAMLPDSQKLRNGVHKFVLRNLAKKYLPTSIGKNPKKGFSMPLREWIDGALFEIVNENIIDLRKRSIVKRDAIDLLLKKYDEHQLSPHKLWYLVSLEMWLKKIL